jgi:CxxC-x17-CxxC domain-containing protein
MSDQQISCSDCGDVFLFSDAEQTFYREKGLAAPPKRCKACRAARKASGPHAGAPGAGRGGPRRGPGGGAGGNDRTSNDPNGYRSPMSMGGWGGQSQDRGRGPAPARGGDTRGQFAPRGGGGGDRRPTVGGPRNDRPRGNGGFSGGGGGGGAPYRSPAFPEARGEARPAPRGNGGNGGGAPRARAERPERPKFDITCVTCGVQAQVPFKPIEGREVFCKTCYQARRGEPRPADVTQDPDGTDRGIVE